jgi:cytidine deaminase
MTESDEQLLKEARRAAEKSYAPYSTFRVGAAVRANGRIYSAANVENASYGLSMCAERAAIFAAVGDGVRQIDAVALACIDTTRADCSSSQMPCGACRQVMAEFGSPNLPVYVDQVGAFTLSDLLPDAFTLAKK